MKKINNSFTEFTKQARNLNYIEQQEAYDKINNPATKLDNFLKISQFSARLNKKEQCIIDDIYPKTKTTIKPSYYFVEHYPRFSKEVNQNHTMFGQQLSQFRSDTFNQVKKEFKEHNYSFHFDSNKITYSQRAQVPTERRNELLSTKMEQEAFKCLRKEVDFLNRKNRILDNIHKEENQINRKTRSFEKYQKYKNADGSIEFYNKNEFIRDQLNNTFSICKSWKSKGKNNSKPKDNQIFGNNNIEQFNNKKNKLITEYDKQNRREFRPITLTKDEYF